MDYDVHHIERNRIPPLLMHAYLGAACAISVTTKARAIRYDVGIESIGY